MSLKVAHVLGSLWKPCVLRRGAGTGVVLAERVSKRSQLGIALEQASSPRSADVPDVGRSRNWYAGYRRFMPGYLFVSNVRAFRFSDPTFPETSIPPCTRNRPVLHVIVLQVLACSNTNFD